MSIELATFFYFPIDRRYFWRYNTYNDKISIMLPIFVSKTDSCSLLTVDYCLLDKSVIKTV